MARIGAGGEEWRAMDSADLYDPNDHDDILRDAKDSIERIRKTDIELRLVRRDGSPLAETAVDVVQKRQAFCFGDQLWGLDRAYRNDQAHHDRWRYYKRRFADLLNSATALCYWTERTRNDGPKSEDLQGEPQYEYFHACVDWASAEGLTVKGHPLFWSIPKCVPDWVMKYDHETRMKFAEIRVRNLVAGARGKVTVWDIVNEALWEPAFKNLDHRHWPHIESADDLAEYIAPVLGWARQEDPDALYTVNDYGLTGSDKADAPTTPDGTRVTSRFQRERFLELIDALDARGALPDVIGLQSHTGGWSDHALQIEAYEHLAQAGLPLHITEFWAHTRHLQEAGMPQEQIDQLQAEYVGNFLTVAFGHPAVESFFFWGIMGNAVRWRNDRSSGHDLTPLYHRMDELINNEWMTRESLTTDADGVVRFRGFFGDYTVRRTLESGQPTGTRFGVEKGQTGRRTLIVDPARP